MKNRHIALAALLGLWLPPMFASDESAKQQDAIKKIEQAVDRTNIFELPSFQMKADVQIETQGKLVDGNYELLWNGPNEWREEIHFPGFVELQEGGQGTVWFLRSTEFLPLHIYDLHAALGFGSGAAFAGASSASLTQPILPQNATVRKLRKRKEHGEAQTCAEFADTMKRAWDVCLNDDTGTLARSPISFVDRDVQAVGGGKVYPRFLSFAESGKTLAQAAITEITSPAQFPPNSFSPPSGVSPAAGCMNPTLPRLIKKVQPQYPLSAKRDHVQGLVAFDARIGIDGTPKIGKLVARVSPDLERSAEEAIKQWRYEPALCEGKPVDVETVLRVIYSISY